MFCHLKRVAHLDFTGMIVFFFHFDVSVDGNRVLFSCTLEFLEQFVQNSCKNLQLSKTAAYECCDRQTVELAKKTKSFVEHGFSQNWPLFN